MVENGLFEDLPESKREGLAKVAGAPRLREPVRDQVELRAVDLEALLGADHPARMIWSYVSGLDLRELEEGVRARAHTPGQAPVSPRLLLALWLYATSDGVGSARALAQLCTSHDAYRWLCGGVSVNYHGLSDFRVGQGALLDRLLSEHLASLSVAGVIDLDEVVQDGVRVRAAAGAGSYRRRRTLKKELRKAHRLVARLAREREADPDAGNRRRRAAAERAARERAQRVQAALAKLEEIEAERERRSKTNKKEVAKQKEPRASTTDAEARVMKMADGGFRPAYNLQFATDTAAQVITGVELDNSGGDMAQMTPMLDQLERRYEQLPEEMLVDGGFANREAIDAAAQRAVTVYAPVPRPKDRDRDPHVPRPGDAPGVAAWRERMGTEQARDIYRERAATAECVNAIARNRGLRQFGVRGRTKARAVALWYAIAHNMMRALTLQNLAAAPSPP